MLTALTITVAGCSALQTERPLPTAMPPPITVDPEFAASPVIIGDSLTEMSRDVLATWLDRAVVDAASGRTMVTPGLTDAAISRVAELPREPGRPWIVALGTNDAGYDLLPPDELAADLSALLEAIGTDRCLAWVLPHVESPRPPEEIASVDAFAAVVTDTMASLPCGSVLDWPSVVAATPGLIDNDGVHLTPAGVDAFVILMATQIAAWSS
jgi:lysophospholipase L1-like esterase